MDTQTVSAQTLHVNVTDVVGGSICVAQDDGHRLCAVLKEALEAGHDVVLSFAGVKDLTASFLVPAIGPLVLHFDEETVQNRLHVRDLKPAREELIWEIVRRFRLYHENREVVNAIWERVLEGP